VLSPSSLLSLQDAACSVASDEMSAGESHLGVPVVPNGFTRKVVLRAWVFERSTPKEQRLKPERSVYYQPCDHAGQPAGQKLTRRDSVEEYLRVHPQMGLSLDSFCFERYRYPPPSLSLAQSLDAWVECGV
jgi:hypothetical protein